MGYQRDGVRGEGLQTFSGWKAALALYPATDNAFARERLPAPGPTVHLNPFQWSLAIKLSPLPLLHSGIAVVFLCVLSGKLPDCHSVD
jgi:hypothetical protein